MAHNTAEAIRAQRMEAQRDKERADFERMKLTVEERNNVSGVSSITSRFASKSDYSEEQLKTATVGLVTYEDFKRKQSDIETALQEKEREERERAAALLAKKRKRRQKKSKRTTAALSFDLDDDAEGGAIDNVDVAPSTSSTSADTTGTSQSQDGESSTTVSPTEQLTGSVGTKRGERDEANTSPDKKQSHTTEDTAPAKKRKFGKFGKDPSVNTSFLPDKDRQYHEEQERERLKKKFQKIVAKEKKKFIEVTYSYWDGSGHRRKLQIPQGTTVSQFLGKVREEFKELRSTSVENLIFIKEDLLIPHHFSFYDLISTKARGKSGPLLNWDVHDDIRMLADATKEKNESHAAKVVERRWYERNKHIFPASRWEVYDPEVQREKYTVHGE